MTNNENARNYEYVNITIGITGTAVHGGTRVDGELLPFPHCGARAVHVAAETDAPITCPKCLKRAARRGVARVGYEPSGCTCIELFGDHDELVESDQHGCVIHDTFTRPCL